MGLLFGWIPKNTCIAQILPKERHVVEKAKNIPTVLSGDILNIYTGLPIQKYTFFEFLQEDFERLPFPSPKASPRNRISPSSPGFRYSFVGNKHEIISETVKELFLSNSDLLLEYFTLDGVSKQLLLFFWVCNNYWMLLSIKLYI